MNKHLEILRARHFELSKAFLIALQNDRPSAELEIIRQQIKDVVAQLEASASEETTPGET